jgi:lipopolysaccharide/colanic/teichoic acid biosynthesis glycosyltransferase
MKPRSPRSGLVQPAAPANAGSSSRRASGVIGPAWLRFPFANTMRMSTPFQAGAKSAMGRLAAFVVLILFLPALVLVGFLLRTNSDEPVLLTDEVLGAGGTKFRIHRFRTTGRGSSTFRAIGRFLRSVGYDDLPALWDVVRGRIDLVQLYRLDRKR